jgi:cob(I)alamin adenosyltransferase
MVITGRGAMPLILDSADLVTEMHPVKHYFKKGVKARLGIEK